MPQSVWPKSVAIQIEPLAPFASIDMLRTWLGEPELPELEAKILLEMGSDAVRAEVGQTINFVNNDNVSLDGRNSPLVQLPEIEVTEVTEVTLNDKPLAFVRDYLWDSAGNLWRTYRSASLYSVWPKLPRCINVTYSHGWLEGSPQWLMAQRVTLEVISRMRRNPEMLQSERIGDWSRAFVPTAGRSELTPTEKRALDRLRLER